jgi:hypothetical protein
MMTRMRYALALGLAAVLLAGAVASAQFRRGRERQAFRYEAQVPYNGRFTFARIRYNGGFSRREPSWAHDYPTGERNFMAIMNEVSFLNPNPDGNIVGLEEPALFKYPVVYMAEPGFWVVSEEEAKNFREYLLKGGFAIFDDFRGQDWYNFEAQMQRVLPESRWIQVDAAHSVFHSFFEIPDPLAFIPPYNRELNPQFWGVFEDNDTTKRLMVVANFNNDLSEYWEYSATGAYAIADSNEAYKFGVNYVIYALTH